MFNNIEIHLQGILTEICNIFVKIYRFLRFLTVTDKKLLTACETGNLNGVNSLLQRGANPNAQNAEGKTALMIAASFGIDNNKLKANCDADKRKNSETAFKMVGMLLRAGANVEGKDNKKNTALIRAARNGRLDIVNALVNAGADVNAQNGKGYTALMRAVQHAYVKTVRVLRNNGADKNIVNDDGKKAIDILRMYAGSIDKDVYDELLELLS